MYPILARYGGIFIYSYTVVLGLGVLVALLLTARLARASALTGWFDGALALFLGALLGGRMGFVVGQWAYYRENLQELWSFNQGGLSYHAAVLGGLLLLWAWARRGGRDFYAYAALYLPGLAMLGMFGWAACWLDGCAYGRVTILGPFAADLPDEFGVFAVRYQTQLLGLFLSALILALLLWLRPRLSPEVLFWAGLGLLAAAQLLPALWRGDPVYLPAGRRLDYYLNGLMILLAAAGILHGRQNRRRVRGQQH